MAYRDKDIEEAIMMLDNEQFLCSDNEVNKRKERWFTMRMRLCSMLLLC